MAARLRLVQGQHVPVHKDQVVDQLQPHPGQGGADDVGGLPVGGGWKGQVADVVVGQIQPGGAQAHGRLGDAADVDVRGIDAALEGSIYASDINIRRIAEAAMSLRSAGLYLAHNHISNLAFPSAADWQTTDVIRSALAGVGLELIDHLIFVDGDVLSLNQSESGGHRPVYELL